VRPERRATSAGSTSFLEEDSNGWLVTFSDLVLQLFAFVLVAAVLTPGSAGRPTAVETVRPRPHGAVRTVSSIRADEPDALSLARFDELPHPRVPEPPPAAPAVSMALAVPAAPLAPEPTEEAQVAAAPETVPATSLAAELESFVNVRGLEESVQVAVNGGGVTLSISDTIGFASGSTDLLPDASPVLAEVRSLVEARTDLVVEVAGHTDDRPVHAGAFQSNLALSLARAARVAHELAGGDSELTARIFAAGYGAQRPVASNLDGEGRARNRRVELRLVPGRDDASDAPRVAGLPAARLAAR
jgi:flagellar motor protein MotB